MAPRHSTSTLPVPPQSEMLEHRASARAPLCSRSILALSTATTLLLFLAYFSILPDVFVYADEHSKLGPLDSTNVYEAIWDGAERGFRSMGRPFSTGTYVAFQAMAGDGYAGLVWVRAVSLVLAAIFISTVATIFGLAWQSRTVAWATAIMLIGAPVTQAAAFYSMTSPYMVGSAAAAVAATLVMAPAGSRAGFTIRCGAAFTLLQSSWFFYQFAPFVAGPVAAAFALSSLARQRKIVIKKQLIVGLLLLSTMLVFTLIYRALGTIKEGKPQHANNLIDILISGRLGDAVSHIRLERAFQTSYFSDMLDFSITGALSEGMVLIYVLIMLAFVASLLMLFAKYRFLIAVPAAASVLLSVALLASPMIPFMMDNFSMRQHTLLPATLSSWVIVISSGFFIAEAKFITISSGLRWASVILLLLASITHLAAGAAKVKLNVVDPYVALGDYIEGHLSAFAGDRIDILEVVLPEESEVRNRCRFPPCLGFYKRGPVINRQFGKPDMLRQFARRAGVIDGPATVVIVGPEEAGPAALRVDLFARAKYGTGER